MLLKKGKIDILTVRIKTTVPIGLFSFSKANSSILSAVGSSGLFFFPFLFSIGLSRDIFIAQGYAYKRSNCNSGGDGNMPLVYPSIDALALDEHGNGKGNGNETKVTKRGRKIGEGAEEERNIFSYPRMGPTS